MNYPDHWWKAVPESERADWEILPQAADPKQNEVILSKRNELGLLSNFSPTPFTFRGRRYASMEGFWQSLKYPEKDFPGGDPRLTPASSGVRWEFTREQVEGMLAFDAHGAGVKAEENMKKLGVEWVSFAGEKILYKTDPAGIDRHFQLISEATAAKVDQNPEVKRVLLSTGSLRLKPDHFEDHDGTKSWKYYEIYMQLRDKLRSSRNNASH